MLLTNVFQIYKRQSKHANAVPCPWTVIHEVGVMS